MIVKSSVHFSRLCNAQEPFAKSFDGFLNLFQLPLSFEVAILFAPHTGVMACDCEQTRFRFHTQTPDPTPVGHSGGGPELTTYALKSTCTDWFAKPVCVVAHEQGQFKERGE